MKAIKEAIRFAGDLMTLATAVMAAVHNNDIASIDEIVPKQLRTTIAKAAADERARQKFEGLQ